MYRILLATLCILVFGADCFFLGRRYEAGDMESSSFILFMSGMSLLAGFVVSLTYRKERSPCTGRPKTGNTATGRE